MFGERGIYGNIVLGDARRLPFKDKSFEAVVCIEVLKHIYVWSLEELKAKGFTALRGKGTKGMSGER